MTQLLERGRTEIATCRPRPSFEVRSSDSMLMTRAVDRTTSPWERVNCQLKSWRDQPACVLEPEAVEQGLLFARLLAEDGEPAPSRVGMSNNGGVVFEWESGEALTHIEILDALHAEYTEFHGTTLTKDAELRWDPREQVYDRLDS